MDAPLRAEVNRLLVEDASVREEVHAPHVRRAVEDVEDSILQKRLTARNGELPHALVGELADELPPFRRVHLRPRLQHPRIPRTRAEPALVIAPVGQLQRRDIGQNGAHFFGSPSSSRNRGKYFFKGS